MSIVYLNGEFLPQEQAFVSVMDRGFLFGDGVYEVLPVYNGKLFRFEQHLARLNKSLSAIKLSVDYNHDQWQAIFLKLLELNREFGKNQSIYFQITRGAAKERNHAFPHTVNPSIFALSQPLKTLTYEELKKGKQAITHEDTRWQRCNIKATSLLANVLLYQEALEQNRSETILIRDGYAVEGSTSNLFIVEHGKIITPPLSPFILGGVTRDLVIDLAKKFHFHLIECSIPEAQLFRADEVWITSSTREIYPIVKINAQPVGNGVPGEIWKKMIKKYREFIENI